MIYQVNLKWLLLKLIDDIQKKLCVIALVLYAFSTYAQKPIFKHYTTENGLPHDITYQIIQDKQGYVWIGTDDGLAKFNGINFRNYSYDDGLQSNYVIDIIERSPADFLIGTWGAGLHTLKNDRIVKLPISNDEISHIKKIYLLNDSIIYSSLDAAYSSYNLNRRGKKEYYFGEEDQAPKVMQRSKTYDDKTVYCFSENFINDTLYIFANEVNDQTSKALKGIYYFNDNELHQLNYPKLNNIEIHSAAKKDGCLFVASFNTIFVYKNHQLIDEQVLSIENEKILDLQVVNEKLYFVSLNLKNGERELYCYELKKKLLHNISKDLGINSMISDFMFDRNTNLWITTYGQGVYCVPNFSNMFFGSDFFSNPDLKDIISSGGHLLAIAPNTLYQIEDDSLTERKNIPFHVENFQVDRKEKQIKLIVGRLPGNFESTFSMYSVTNRSGKSYLFHSDSTDIKIEVHLVSVLKNDTLCSVNASHESDAAIVKAILSKDRIYVIYNRLGVYVF